MSPSVLYAFLPPCANLLRPVTEVVSHFSVTTPRAPPANIAVRYSRLAITLSYPTGMPSLWSLLFFLGNFRVLCLDPSHCDSATGTYASQVDPTWLVVTVPHRPNSGRAGKRRNSMSKGRSIVAGPGKRLFWSELIYLRVGSTCVFATNGKPEIVVTTNRALTVATIGAGRTWLNPRCSATSRKSLLSYLVSISRPLAATGRWTRGRASLAYVSASFIGFGIPAPNR